PLATFPLSLHDALPIWKARIWCGFHLLGDFNKSPGQPLVAELRRCELVAHSHANRRSRSAVTRKDVMDPERRRRWRALAAPVPSDRKSTRLNSSHSQIS